ncbi:hypothetical protein SUDANB108_00264 [Streptomyces sp. enrichment culture]|uniref:FG-GAP repeat domain-containing protein n=1 Tax=Streptomyces sp. enrichment culture TaxID=1795815 RepID=UPI003F55DE85
MPQLPAPRLRRTVAVALALLATGTATGLTSGQALAVAAIAKTADTAKTATTAETGEAVHAADAADAMDAVESMDAVHAADMRQDFNGDGYEDVAIGAPDATVGGAAKAGYVAVLYGAPEGFGAGKKVFSQVSPGVPGTPEANDRFGASLATADLDHDGYTDLVVESAGERWESGGAPRSGNRTVLWGGPSGFASGKVLPADGNSAHQAGRTVSGDFDGDGHQDLVHRTRVVFGPLDRAGVPARVQHITPVEGDMLLAAMAAGDPNGDGITDLVTVARGYDPDDEGDYGHQLHLLRGTGEGLAAPRTLRNAQGHPVQPVGDVSAVALGDVDGDGRDDIVTGGETLTVLPGTSGGPAVPDPRVITQNSPGVPGTQEAGDGFGRGLAIDDVDGDGYDDILAGVPLEDFSGLTGAGTFAVVPGAAQGPTGAGTRVISQNTAGVPGTAESSDRFGERVALVDSDADGRSEPVVAAVGEDSDAGAVWVFRASSAGVPTSGSFSFGAQTLGTVKAGAALGSSLTP